MKISVGNSFSYVESATPFEMAWLDNYTSCNVTNVVRTGSGAWGPEITRFSLLTPDGYFATGIVLGPFVQAAATMDIKIEFENNRTPPCQAISLEERDELLAWLRPYQRACIEDIVKYRGRGIVKAPTAAGKTSIFFACTTVYRCQWLFLVHRADIAEQVAQDYVKHARFSAGKWEAGKWKRGTGNVTVSTFQAISAGLRNHPQECKAFLARMGGVNVDEVHSLGAPTYYQVTQALEQTYYRIGQSGTPWDKKGKDENLRIVGAVGPMIHEIMTQELISLGFAAKPKITMHRFEHAALEDGEAQSDHWVSYYKRRVVYGNARNKLITQIVLDANKPCLCFVENVKHGEILKTMFARAGLAVSFAHGDQDTAMRKSKLGQLDSGQYDVLICTVIFREGVNAPNIASVMTCGGKSSVIAMLQQGGRGMRIAESKKSEDGGFEFQLHDIFDVSHKSDKQWLSKHALARKAAYEQEGHEVEIR